MNGGAIASTSTSRAAIKKALLAIQLTRQHQEQTASSSLPAVQQTTRRFWQSGAGVDASALGAGTQGGIMKGRTVSDQVRKRERLNRARSKGLSHSSLPIEAGKDDAWKDDSDSSGSDTPQRGESKTESKSGEAKLEMPITQSAPTTPMVPTFAVSPFGSGLAAMKVKHRLQALHQEAKKKPHAAHGTSSAPPSSGADFSVSVTTSAELRAEKAAEKARIEAQESLDAQQAAAVAAMNAAINAARTTLPNFSSTPDEAEEAEIINMLGEAGPELMDLVQEVQRILRWLFADGDADFDGRLAHQELKAIFQRAPQPLGSSLGMEVDMSTAHSEKNIHYSRSRFIEIAILVAVRVNQSPILSSRLSEVKRFVGRGSSATGRSLEAAGSTERLPDPKVSLLAGIPRLETSQQGSKWQFAKSAVHDMSERRKSQEDLNPLKKLENLFASVRKS